MLYIEIKKKYSISSTFSSNVGRRINERSHRKRKSSVKLNLFTLNVVGDVIQRCPGHWLAKKRLFILLM